jgi:hypothetical protein
LSIHENNAHLITEVSDYVFGAFLFFIDDSGGARKKSGKVSGPSQKKLPIKYKTFT